MVIAPPLFPLTEETAKQKFQAAEDARNTHDPERVSLAYTEDSSWCNRDEFFSVREATNHFLIGKLNKEKIQVKKMALELYWEPHIRSV
ncbi:MAG: nuclear transport factor 2 (NTF2) superfamily protein [Cellvibrionaceae bacterium]|jgi:nuclear transport factor 2 (NTF2) superfamily protein